MDNARKVDEFDVDFEYVDSAEIAAANADLIVSRDTSAFVAWRYQDIITIITDGLNEQDQLVVQEHRSWQDLVVEIRKMMTDPKSSGSVRRLMASIQPLPRSMATLNGSFISAVAPHSVQFDFLWGMVYLNLKVVIDSGPRGIIADDGQLSYSSTEKLKRTAEWLGNLRRVVELFNRCLDVCEDLNEPRLAMIEIYDHILSMLGEALQHLRSCPTG
jgi:hypothetical protein